MMNKNNYILTIYNQSIFKEINISTKESYFLIGTTPECNIRLKRDLFSISVVISLSKEENGYHVYCNNPLYIKMENIEICHDTSLCPGDYLEIWDSFSKHKIFVIALSYDFSSCPVLFDTIVDIRSVNKLLIGNAKDAQIQLNSSYVKGESIYLSRRKDGNFNLELFDLAKSVSVNGDRVFNNTIVKEYDFIGIADYSFYFKNGVLYTTMRSDISFNGVHSEALRDETLAFEYPKLNRSPRMKYVFDESPIEVLNPPAKPEKSKENLVLQLSPALLMIAVTVVTRSGIIEGFGSGNISFLIFSLSTMAIGIFTSVFSFVYNRRNYRKAVDEWEADYSVYIERKRQEIEAEQQIEQQALNDIYPSSIKMREMIKTFSSRIFERSSKDDDFLYIRAGQGKIPMVRKITCRNEEHIKLDNELMLIPEQIRSEYASLQNAPVLLHLKQAGAVGVLGTEDERYEFFKTIMMDLCMEHSYEDVQIIVLIPSGEKEKYEWVKWIPHIKASGGDCRGIVCDDGSKDDIFENLYALMTKRFSQYDKDELSNSLHYVIFVLDEYGIKTHPLFRYMDVLQKIQISFVFFQAYKENLPRQCIEIINLHDNNKGELFLANNKSYMCEFEWEHVNDESIRFMADRLAPVYCEEITLSSRLTSNITLFDLLNIYSPEDINLPVEWKKSNVTHSLAVPLGVDVKGNVVSLDLHEKAHGPHGLVAGTTGSGKSEIMQSFVISCALKFHPYEVSFVIIDFKGGGMANQFNDLPHLIGKITDIDDHEINRSLVSIRAELERRKRLFVKYNVNHIDQYIRLFKKGETSTALPHLILIVDEFAELKAEQPEFMKELISAARVGRSLGIHLILATQKPAGQVNEQIWSNSRFKLCLKVAAKEDSIEVLRSPLAYEIREPGRAYLQVGNNEVFTLFQSAYSGASAISDTNGNTREFKISEVSFTGKRTLVYERKATKSSDGTKLTQLKALVDYINHYCSESGIEKLPGICLPPLPQEMDYESDHSTTSNRHIIHIGIYDDPGSQQQPEATIDLSVGNVMVIGAAQTGKTMLLQLIMRRVAEHFGPNEAEIYILDFASKMLKVYEKMNHVGGVMTDSDEERIKNFFKMIGEEIEYRKELFSELGISSYEAYTEILSVKKLTRIIIIIDNILAFKESYQEYEDYLLNLCREGLSLGITVIVTAKQTAGISYRYMSNFASRIAFNCTERNEYSNIFERCQIRPQNFPGRGLIAVQNAVYEFQARIPFDGIVETENVGAIRTEGKRIEQIHKFIARISEKYGERKAKPIPEIPAVLTNRFWIDKEEVFPQFTLPIGLAYNDISTVTLDLAHVGSIGVLEKEEGLKTNFAGLILGYLQRNVFNMPSKIYILDNYERQLKQFEPYGIVERFSIDCSDVEDIVDYFDLSAQERMNTLESGESLDQYPLLLCIINNHKIFENGVVQKGVSDRIKKLIANGKMLKLCFLFSSMENNGEFSASEMIKITRDLGEYILCENINNIKLFGSGKFTPAELRQFKKPLSLGDAYFYNSRDGIKKIKLVRTDEG